MFKELVHKADLGNGYYMNPILDGDYADPVLESGRIDHSESDRNSQFELNRNSQCTLAN